MKAKINYLTFLDIIVLTIILFGSAIFSSSFEMISTYFIAQPENAMPYDAVQFTETQNIIALLSQLIFLLVAFGYLYWRNFDFKQLKFTFSLSAILKALGLFLLIALAMDLYFYALDYVTFSLNNEAYQQQLQESLALNDELLTDDASFNYFFTIGWSLIVYSIFNGFYEEIFFLGLCLCVKPTYQKWAFLYSLLIRFSFHTYQGVESALGITLILGVIFYVLWKRSSSKNLVPFSLAHSLGDIFGVGILAYFYQITP